MAPYLVCCRAQVTACARRRPVGGAGHLQWSATVVHNRTLGMRKGVVRAEALPPVLRPCAEVVERRLASIHARAVATGTAGVAGARRLAWDLSRGTCVVKATIPGSGTAATLLVSTLQACILSDLSGHSDDGGESTQSALAIASSTEMGQRSVTFASLLRRLSGHAEAPTDHALGPLLAHALRQLCGMPSPVRSRVLPCHTLVSCLVDRVFPLVAGAALHTTWGALCRRAARVERN